jgi:hypothetical protein
MYGSSEPLKWFSYGIALKNLIGSNLQCREPIKYYQYFTDVFQSKPSGQITISQQTSCTFHFRFVKVWLRLCLWLMTVVLKAKNNGLPSSSSLFVVQEGSNESYR